MKKFLSAMLVCILVIVNCFTTTSAVAVENKQDSLLTAMALAGQKPDTYYGNYYFRNADGVDHSVSFSAEVKSGVVRYFDFIDNGTYIPIAPEDQYGLYFPDARPVTWFSYSLTAYENWQFIQYGYYWSPNFTPDQNGFEVAMTPAGELVMFSVPLKSLGGATHAVVTHGSSVYEGLLSEDGLSLNFYFYADPYSADLPFELVTLDANRNVIATLYTGSLQGIIAFVNGGVNHQVTKVLYADNVHPIIWPDSSNGFSFLKLKNLQFDGLGKINPYDGTKSQGTFFAFGVGESQFADIYLMGGNLNANAYLFQKDANGEAVLVGGYYGGGGNSIISFHIPQGNGNPPVGVPVLRREYAIVVVAGQVDAGGFNVLCFRSDVMVVRPPTLLRQIAAKP